MARKLLEAFMLGATVEATLTIVDKKKLTFTAKIGTDDVCDSTGKIKRFRDADTFVNNVLSASPSTTSVQLTINTAGVRVPKIPADPVAAATATKARLVARKAAATAKVTELTATLTAIAAYNNSGNAGLQAYFDEITTQKTSVEAVVTFLDAQIAIQDAIISP